MKRFVVFILIGLASTILFGQASKTATESFPTYQQIKPTHAEIIDFVPQGMPGQFVMSSRRAPINLFDYPEKTVTYVLNGKPTTNVGYAKEVINKKETQVDRINIHEPTQDGKRIIEIEYTIRQ